jgi:hypothetical protein
MIGVSDSSVHRLDWDSQRSWYDIEQFRAAAGDEAKFDFALIDGPNSADGNSRGIRDNEVGLKAIQRCIYRAEVVIVDDVHRRHILDSVDAMLGDPAQYEKWYYDYRVIEPYSNTLCICVKKSRIGADLATIRSMLDVPLYDNFDRAHCPED